MVPIQRREFMQALSLGTGSCVLDSMLSRLQAEANGVSAKQRVIFVVEGNGLPWQQIQPAGIERNRKLISSGGYSNRNGDFREGVREIALTEHKLPQALSPLEFAKNQVTVIQGLSGKMNGGGHSNDYGALGAYNAKGGVGSSGAPNGETIDCALGRRLGGVFTHLGLGMVEQTDQSIVYNSSAFGRNNPAPVQCNPELAFQALFGHSTGGNAKKAFNSRKPLLDHLVEDVKRAEAKLASPEREKLQSYLASFESMRERHGKLVEMEAVLKQHAPPVTNKFTSEVETDRLDAQFDIATAALVAGLTNSVTLASGVGNPYFSVKFSGLGIQLGKHGIGHGGSFNGRTWDELSTAIRQFHFELIARMVKKLQAVPEGNGTMWDNTLIVYLSDAAEGHHSRCWEWPMVLVGSFGGKLKPGRYLELPSHGARQHKHIGNLYTTLLNAAGDRRESFGQPDPIIGNDMDQKGGIAELLV
jgi:Protein of unknown function (DUF1552)